MEVNYLVVIVATVVQFIIGAVWYSVFFAKLWGKIHGFDKLSKETQQKMMKEMGPFYALQVLVTFVTAFVLTVLIANVTTWSPYILAGHLWIGFVVPTQVSSVIFGGTESKWIFPKIAVQAGASLLCLQAAAAVIYFML